MINTNELKEIIKDLQNVIKELNLSISQEIIFENACQYHRGQLANQSKEQKKEPLTENQYNFLKKNESELITLGFDLNNIQTKNDAFKVISEYKKLKEVKNENRRKTNIDY